MRRSLTVLISVLLAGGATAWCGVDTLAWVSEAGGAVTRDARGRVVSIDLHSSWASDSDLATLAEIPGLSKLDLSETRVTDHGLRQLKSAPAITDLNLRYAELITDQGISALKGWKHLARLDLQGTKITDSSLQQLSALTSLQVLNIGSVQVTDAGLDALTALTKLTELTLGGDKLTDAGLQPLRQLPALTVLNLGGVQRTDSGPWSVSFTQPGLQAIATLKMLRQLRLEGTLINARGLETIKSLPQIEVLDLHDCKQIADDSVPVLTEMQSLRVLDLSETKVSAAAVERLRKTKPNCRIFHAAATVKHDAGSVDE